MAEESKCVSCRRYRNVMLFQEGYSTCDMCIVKVKNYRKENQEKNAEQKRIYRQQNREIILQKQREYQKNTVNYAIVISKQQDNQCILNQWNI